MLVVELTIGLILLIFGTAVTAYLVYFLIQQKEKDVSLIHLSESIATILLGIFYVICSVLVLNTGEETDLLSEGFFHKPNITFFEAQPQEEKGEFVENVFNVENFYEASGNLSESLENVNETTSGDYLKKFQSFFKDIVEKKVRNETVKNFFYNNEFFGGRSFRESCSFEEIALKYSMLVVSFLYGLLALVNSTMECKDCEKNGGLLRIFVKGENRGEILNEDSLSVSTVTSENKDFKKSLRVLLRLSLTWIVPIIYTIIVYYTMKPEAGSLKVSEIRPLPSEFSQIIEKPLNVTNNSSEANEIVEKIYKIVGDFQTSQPVKNATYPPIMFDIIDHFNNRRDRSLKFACDYKNMPLKLHTLILFIIGYFLGLFYTKTEQTKLRMEKDDWRVGQLGKNILAFGSLWMPSILEVFTRTYLMDYEPNVVSDVFLAVGNGTRIVANVFNLLTVKDLLKKRSNVGPIA